MGQMGGEWGGRERRAKTIGAEIKVQGTAFRTGIVKLDQPALMVRAAAAAAADTAGWTNNLETEAEV